MNSKAVTWHIRKPIIPHCLGTGPIVDKQTVQIIGHKHPKRRLASVLTNLKTVQSGVSTVILPHRASPGLLFSSFLPLLFFLTFGCFFFLFNYLWFSFSVTNLILHKILPSHYWQERSLLCTFANLCACMWGAETFTDQLNCWFPYMEAHGFVHVHS